MQQDTRHPKRRIARIQTDYKDDSRVVSIKIEEKLARSVTYFTLLWLFSAIFQS